LARSLGLKRRGLNVWPGCLLPTARSASGKLPAKSGRQCANAGACTSRERARQAAEEPAAKRQARQEIWMAETKADAEAAFDAFIESYQIKYKKQSNLNKDCDVLVNLRATSPIDSTFATVR
jgi:putative transposase